MSKVPSGHSNMTNNVINHKPLKNEKPDLKRKLQLPLENIGKRAKSNNLLSPGLDGSVMVTPGGVTTPVVKNIVFPELITEEQKRFAEGFDKALEDCKNEKYEPPQVAMKHGEEKKYTQMKPVSQPVNQPMTRRLSAAAAAAQKMPQQTFVAPAPYYTINVNDLNNHHQEEVQLKNTHVVPSFNTIPMPQKMGQAKAFQAMAPVNLDNQETMKMERKRERNREAARKCRERKLTKIAELQGQIEKLKQHNSSLSSRVESLKNHLGQLDQQIRDHQRAGCAISYQLLRYS